MLKDETTLKDTADNDEDVLDLLEVVKPGKISQNPKNADDMDFSADLDSMLESLAQSQDAQPQAMDNAFPDPTPVDHEVNHNESLALPGLDDLDAILRSLGVKKQPEDPAPAHGTADKTQISTDLEDLDAKPANGAKPPKAPGALDADYLDSLLTEENEHADSAAPAAGHLAPDQHSAAKDSEYQAADSLSPADEEIEELIDPTNWISSPEPLDKTVSQSQNLFEQDSPQEEPMAELQLDPALPKEPLNEASQEDPAYETGEQDMDSSTRTSNSRFDEVDLNELDALLDDMLASGPAPGARPGKAVEDPLEIFVGEAEPAPSLPEMQKEAEPDIACAPPRESELENLWSEMQSLREQLTTLTSDVAASQKNDKQAKESESMSTTTWKAALDKKLLDTEEKILALEARLDKNNGTGELRTRLNQINERVARLETLAASLEDGLKENQAEKTALATLDELYQRVARFETQAASLEAELKENQAEKKTLATLDELHQHVARFDAQAMSLEAGLDKNRELLESISANTDKVAAEAAARIIREEIADLIADAGEFEEPQSLSPQSTLSDGHPLAGQVSAKQRYARLSSKKPKKAMT